MINNSNKLGGKCALCGKAFTEQQQAEKSSIIEEVIDETSYKFDTKGCIVMFKRFRSIYGNDFKELLGEQQQFISDPFWNRAIPTEQEITEIDKETGLDRQDIVQLIRDPVKIQKIAFEIGERARDEILIIFSTANAFSRQVKLGAIRSLKELVEEKRGIKIRMLIPKEEPIEEPVQMLKQQQHQKIDIRYIEPGLQTQVTVLVADRKSSLILELKDDTKDSSYEAMGLGTYSNRRATVLSYVSIFESLWKQSELYEKINELYEQLKDHDKMQKEFIDIAAHELRTPIQPILALAQILRSRKENISTPIYDEYLSVIIRNARRLKELTGNILDVARIESQSINLNKEVVDIDGLILNAIQDIKNQIDNHHKVSLLYDDFRKEDVIFVEADKDKITQVISNLLNNAIKFTNEGTIIVSTERNATDVLVSIRDTGTGIDSDVLPQLFTKFTTKSTTGTGLGLFISKSIIEAHGGRIWAENNKDGKGATFSFSLPLKR